MLKPVHVVFILWNNTAFVVFAGGTAQKAGEKVEGAGKRAQADEKAKK